MKKLLILSLFLFSTSASAYCVKYNSYGTCIQDNGVYQPNNNYGNYGNSYGLGVKPVPVVPPVGTKKCDWVAINGQWQSVCY